MLLTMFMEYVIWIILLTSKHTVFITSIFRRQEER